MDTRKIVWFAFLATCSIALSACDSTPNPSASPTPAPTQSNSTASSSSEASSTPTPSNKYVPATAEHPAKNVPVPKMPAEAKKNTEEGAAAFAEHYFALINYAIETNDASHLKKVTSRQCQVCGESLIDPAERAKISGKWQVGGKHHYEVWDSFKSNAKKSVVSVSFRVDAAVFYIEPNKKESEKDKSERRTASLVLEFGDGWKVASILLVEPAT